MQPQSPSAQRPVELPGRIAALRIGRARSRGAAARDASGYSKRDATYYEWFDVVRVSIVIAPAPLERNET